MKKVIIFVVIESIWTKARSVNFENVEFKKSNSHKRVRQGIRFILTAFFSEILTHRNVKTHMIYGVVFVKRQS